MGTIEDTTIAVTMLTMLTTRDSRKESPKKGRVKMDGSSIDVSIQGTTKSVVAMCGSDNVATTHVESTRKDKLLLKNLPLTKLFKLIK